MNNHQIEYPIILDEDDSGRPIRLFDSEIESHLRWEYSNSLKFWEEHLANHKSELVRVSVPGFRHPNPAASVEGSIFYHNTGIKECEEMIASIKADPHDYDALSFADKISAQMWLVCMAAPPSKEMAEAFDREVLQVTAEAEIIHLWNSL